MTKILIIEARYYENISDLLLEKAKAELVKSGAQFEVITVSGALEIASVIKMAAGKFDGFVALGCIERGETYHFDIVANESARALTQLGIIDKLLIGNGILTVENEVQAIERADKMDKGGFAAKACLQLIEIKRRLDSYGC